ncbi:MAG: hypothetical protein KY464_10845 [Gemmatimonadetes bacterium]|nr:hypothetical protein [Gemmatimonadota bacterium]
MQKPITPTLHGALDYSTMAATLAAPKLLGFPSRAAWAAYGLAAGYLAMSALTDYPPALKRAVPLKAHGVTDAVLGLAIPALPWVLGFEDDKRARNFFLALTGITMVVTALTDWNANEGQPA